MLIRYATILCIVWIGLVNAAVHKMIVVKKKAGFENAVKTGFFT